MTISWRYLTGGVVLHAVVEPVSADSKAACGMATRAGWCDVEEHVLARCKRCVKIMTPALEDELSADAQAILAYARKWGQPFSRLEIVNIAPGAAWDLEARYATTVAEVDPIRELVRAGLVQEHDEIPTKSSRGKRSYKRWALAGAAPPRSLAELLDAYAEAIRSAPGDVNWEAIEVERDQVRAEILRRFDRG